MIPDRIGQGTEIQPQLISFHDAVLTPRAQKIDQFFSTRVTHLIVRGNASPQKPKPLAPRRGDPARESPKNPFLDGMGTTDLAMKAEAMGMKVWTVKSASAWFFLVRL